MQLLFAGLVLIRLPNLLIAMLTQAMIHQLLIAPGLWSAQLSPQLSATDLFFIMAATALVTAGGYIWNDMVDYPIDRINKPNKVIIHHSIAWHTAYWLYAGFHLAGWILALFLAFTQDKTEWLFLYPLSAGGLWLYSRYLKQRPLSGNILISLYCAGVPGLVWLAEYDSLAVLKTTDSGAYTQIARTLLAYSLFAFLSNLFREIIKDLQDMPGDRAHGLRTLPIVLGIPGTHALLLLNGTLLILCLLIWAWDLAPGSIAWILLISGILLPLIYNLAYLFRSTDRNRYAQISRITKAVMLVGLFILLLTHYLYV